MKFINKSKNTVYLGDIQRSIPYQENQTYEIDVDHALKSKNFQSLVANGLFELIETGNSRIEKNLIKLQDMAKLKLKTNEIQEKEPEPVPNQLEVCIKGHFLEGGGYAKVNRNLVLGLLGLGLNIKVDIMGDPSKSLPDPIIGKIKSLQQRPSREAIRIDSVIPTFGQQSSSKHNILYTTIESYTVPQQFLDLLHNYHDIWVTSDFCKEVLLKSGVKRDIFVLPDSLDTQSYTDTGEKFNFNPSLKNFVFLSVFGWSYRKGYDVLLKAYLEEFGEDEDVTLLIVSKYNRTANSGQYIKKEINQFIQRYKPKNTPHIARVTQDIPEGNFPSLYRACDAYVLPTRGEGFSLTHAEASLCGLPVIGTDACGQSMFLKNDNSYLLPVDRIIKVPPGKMDVHYWDDQEFPDLTSEETNTCLRSLMRDIYENHEEAKEKNKKLRTFIKSNYSIENVARMAKERLEK